MSRIIDTEPYVEEVDAVELSPPPPPPLSVEEAMAVVERVAAEARNNDGIISDPNIIRVDPNLGDMSIVDMLQRSRPYLVTTFVVAALFIVIRLIIILYRQHRAENIADTRARPMDRRSVVREQRRKHD